MSCILDEKIYWVVGYGTLMNFESLSKTVNVEWLYQIPIIPIIINDCKRTYNYPPLGYDCNQLNTPQYDVDQSLIVCTAANIERITNREGHNTDTLPSNAILFPVTQSILERLCEREKGYQLITVSCRPFSHPVNESSAKNNNNSDGGEEGRDTIRIEKHDNDETKVHYYQYCSQCFPIIDDTTTGTVSRTSNSLKPPSSSTMHFKEMGKEDCYKWHTFLFRNTLDWNHCLGFSAPQDIIERNCVAITTRYNLESNTNVTLKARQRDVLLAQQGCKQFGRAFLNYFNSTLDDNTIK